jgi:hypothetical protein
VSDDHLRPLIYVLNYQTILLLSNKGTCNISMGFLNYFRPTIVLCVDRTITMSLPSPWATIMYALNIVHRTTTLENLEFLSQRSGPQFNYLLHRLQVIIFGPLYDLILPVLPFNSSCNNYSILIEANSIPLVLYVIILH